MKIKTKLNPPILTLILSTSIIVLNLYIFFSKQILTHRVIFITGSKKEHMLQQMSFWERR